MDKVDKKILNENGIFYDDVQKKYICLLCQTSGPIILNPGHFKLDKHVARLRSFNNVFIIIEKKPFCKLCTVEIKWYNVEDHAIFHEIVPFWCPPDKNRSFYSNYLMRVKKTYYCHLCDKVLEHWSMAWNHLEDGRHLKLRIKVEADDADEPPKHMYNQWITDGMTPGSKTQIECRVCEVKLDFSEAEEHTQSLTHKEHKLKYCKKILERAKVEKLNETPKQPQKAEQSITQIPREFPKRAMICNFTIEPDTATTEQVKSSSESQPNNSISLNSSRMDLKPPMEQEMLRTVNNRRSDFEFVVTRCNWVLETSHPLFKKIFSSRNCRKLDVEWPVQSLYCLLCAKNIFYGETLKHHVSSENHVNAFKKYGPDCITMTQTTKYYCMCCDESNTDLGKLYEHLISDCHIQLVSELNRRKNDQLVVDQPQDKSSETETNDAGNSQQFCKDLELLSINPVSSPKNSSCDNEGLNHEISKNILQTNAEQSLRSEDKKTDENFQLFVKHSNWVVDYEHPLYQVQMIDCEDLLLDYPDKTYCVICRLHFDSPEDSKEHIVSIEHEDICKQYGCDYIEMTPESNYHCTCCKSTLKNFKEMYMHLMTTEHTRRICENNGIEGEQSIVVELAENHSNETRSNDWLYQPTLSNWLHDDLMWMIESCNRNVNKLSLKNLDPNSAKNAYEQFFTCRLCSTGRLDDIDMRNHVSGERHKKLTEFYGCSLVKIIPNSRYLCTCCMRQKKSIRTMCNHVTSAIHTEKFRRGSYNLLNNVIDQKKQKSSVVVDAKNKVDKKPNFFVRDLDWVIDSVHALFPNRTIKEPHQELVSNVETDLYHCLVCFHDLPGAEITRSHILGEKHRNSMKQYGCHLIQVAPNLNYRCNCCNEEKATFLDIHKHLVSTEHAQMVSFYNAKIAEQSTGVVAKNKEFEVNPKDNRVCPELLQSGSFSFNFPAPQENSTSNRELQPPDNNLPGTSGSNDSQNLPQINAASSTRRRVVAKKSDNSTLHDEDLKWVVGSSHELYKKLESEIVRPQYIRHVQNQLFYCIICFAHFCGIGSVKYHIVDKQHTVSMIQYGCYFIEFNRESKYTCICCNRQKNNFCNIYRHILSEGHMDRLRRINPKTQELSVIDFMGKKVSYSNLNDDESLLTFLWMRSQKNCICFICKDRPISIKRKKADKHINSLQHKFSMMRYGCDNIMIRKNDKIYCICCNYQISDLEDVAAHVRDGGHMSSLFKVNSKPKRFNVVKPKPKRVNVVKNIKPKILIYDNPQQIVESLNRDKNLSKYSENFRKHIEIFNTIYRQLAKKKEPMSSSMILTMVEEVIRLSCQMELNDECSESDESSSNSHNRQAKRNRRSSKDCIPCEFCLEVVDNYTNLHSHMAKHYSEEIISIERCRARNGFVNENEIESLRDSFESTNEENFDCPNELTDPPSDRSVDHNTDSPTSSSPKEFADFLKFDFSSSGSDRKLEGCENEENDEISESDREQRLENAMETSGSTNRIDLTNIFKKTNCDNDVIYELQDKLNDLKMGLRMTSIANNEKIYCLVCRGPVSNMLEDRYTHLWSLDHCNYLDVMESDAAEYADLTNQFSDLDLAHEYMEEISDDTVRCYVCKEDVKNDNEVLGDHIHEDKHERVCSLARENASTLFEMMKSSLKCDYYSIERYSCFVCSIVTESEISFVTHLNSEEHSKKLLEEENIKRKMLLDCCHSCALLWYGYRSSHFHHVNEVVHKWLLNNRSHFIPDLPKFAQTLLEDPENYTDQTIRQFDEIRAQEISKENTLVNDLQAIVKPKFPLATVYTFGSRAIGLNNEDNNIAIFLDCRNFYDGEGMSDSIMLHFIDNVYECLSKNAECWDVLEVSTNCRTPIIRAEHKPTGLACDISLNNGLAVEKSKLIGSIADAYPTFRKLVVILKTWVLHCDLAGPERITETSLHWLVIFYLQSELILPSIKTLISTKNESKIIAGCKVGASYDFENWKPDEGSSVKNLLQGFFTFYAKFDFRFDVVCPLLGYPIKKLDFAHPGNLPKEMDTYVRYEKKSDNANMIENDSPMCIQDPIDLLHDFSKDVKKDVLNQFVICCFKSSEIMASLNGNQEN